MKLYPRDGPAAAVELWSPPTDIAPADRPAKRKPFAAWVKRITSLKNNSTSDDDKKKRAAKHKKQNTVSQNNNPYPASGPLRQRDPSPTSTNGHLSFSTPTSRPQDDAQSYDSVPLDDRDVQSRSNKSGAPTLVTKTGTINSDGHSRAATTTTRNGGALSSTDGATAAGSTFSSPAPSERSLTTTLTTIQSQSTGHVLQNTNGAATSGHHSTHHHGSLNNPNPVMFSHQYPTSPAPASSLTASAIPRHISEAMPNTYSSATANNLLSDDASILTLASSSKRRRRSMDTDASVRALPPSSAWGGSRESLPLSVLSGNLDAGLSGPSGLYGASQSRPSIGGLASAERASIYSAQGVSAPALASERNSFYSHKPGAKDYSDGKSLRSITNLNADARSISYRDRDRDADARSINNMDARSQYGDARSLADARVGGVGAGGEGASLKNYEGSVRSGLLGHGRNDSIPGSVTSPLVSPLSGNARPTGLSSRRTSIEKEDREGLEDDVDGEDEDEHDDVGMDSRVVMQDEATS